MRSIANTNGAGNETTTVYNGTSATIAQGMPVMRDFSSSNSLAVKLCAAPGAMADFVGTNDVIDQPLTDALHAHTGLAVLHLSDTGWEYVMLKREPEAWDAFRGLLTFATWMAAHPDAESITAGVRKSHEREVINARIAGKFQEMRTAA